MIYVQFEQNVQNNFGFKILNKSELSDLNVTDTEKFRIYIYFVGGD